MLPCHHFNLATCAATHVLALVVPFSVCVQSTTTHVRLHLAVCHELQPLLVLLAQACPRNGKHLPSIMYLSGTATPVLVE